MVCDHATEHTSLLPVSRYEGGGGRREGVGVKRGGTWGTDRVGKDRVGEGHGG